MYLASMARTKTPAKKTALHKSIVLLSEDTRAQLVRLAQECTDRIGTTISQSAVLRGLVRASSQHTVADLVAAVEAELQTGTLWGSRPKGGSKK
jgi:hypothetical protein